jgi:hypothetical protein
MSEDLSVPGIPQPDYGNDFQSLAGWVNLVSEGSLSSLSIVRNTSVSYKGIRQCQKLGWVLHAPVGTMGSEILLSPSKTQQIIKMCNKVPTEIKWAKYLDTTSKVSIYCLFLCRL